MSTDKVESWQSINVFICRPLRGVYILQKDKAKSAGRATSRRRSQPLTPGGREKVTQINVCIANKQMHDKHND